MLRSWTKSLKRLKNRIVWELNDENELKMKLFAENQSFISPNSFRQRTNAFSSLIFSIVDEKINEKDVLNISSMDNSIFNSWNSHCSWTKHFLSVESVSSSSLQGTVKASFTFALASFVSSLNSKTSKASVQAQQALSLSFSYQRLKNRNFSGWHKIVVKWSKRTKFDRMI